MKAKGEGNPRGWRETKVLRLPTYGMREDRPGICGRWLALRGGAARPRWEQVTRPNGIRSLRVEMARRGEA